MALERGNRPATTTEQERGTTVADKTKVRTTMLPGQVIEVDERELVDLERQGLIASREGAEDWQADEPVDIESGVITDGLDEQAEGGDESHLTANEVGASAPTDTTTAADIDRRGKTKGAR